MLNSSGRWCVALALGLVAAAGCDSSTKARPIGSPVNVVCTTGQVGDLIRNIGGDHVAVTMLMGPGVDPHLFEPALDTHRSLQEADIVFYNGVHLEGRMSDVLESLARRRPVFAVTQGVLESSPDLLRKPAEFEGAYDPHVWFDASLWARCVQYAAARLEELDPAHAGDYRSNAKKYIERLNGLHASIQQRLAEVPQSQRVLVTAHDAFGYFGQAYDIEVHGLQGISTSDEADIQSIQKLVDLLVSRGVKAVFVESSVPPRNVRALIENCSKAGHEVKLGGELYSDAMGPADSEEGTYIGMMEYNLTMIVDALK